MSKINETYKIILELIKGLNEFKKYTFKSIFLPDLLLSEILNNQLKTEKGVKRIGVIDFTKLYIKGLRYHNSFSKKQIEGIDIIVFVNEYNQWTNVKPVIETLERLYSKNVGVWTTKIKLKNQISHLHHTVNLVYGFSFMGYLRSFLFNHTRIVDSTIGYYLPQVAFLESYFDKVIKNCKPEYIIVGNDITFEGRTLSRVSERYPVKRGMIQHGSVNRANQLYERILAQHFFVYGRKVAEELKYIGKSIDSVIVSGWPMQHEIREKVETYKEKYASKKKHEVLITLSGVGHSTSLNNHQLIIESLAKLQAELDINYCVKLHPKDHQRHFDKFDSNKTRFLSHNEMIDQKKDIYELICSSRCVVTGSSSSALDALMTGTPVITVDMMGEYNEIDFIKDGLTLHATDYNQLRGHMLSVIDTHAVNYQSPSGVNNYFFEWQNGHYSASNFIANYIANTCVE